MRRPRLAVIVPGPPGVRAAGPALGRPGPPVPRRRLVGAGVEGWWIACPGTARWQLAAALFLARGLGAGVALVGRPLSGRAGRELPGRWRGLWLTAGDALGTVTAAEALVAAAGRGPEYVVWGADCRAGALAARILVRAVRHLTLFGSRAAPLEQLARRLLAEAGLVADVLLDPRAAAARAGVVVVAAHAEALLAVDVPSGAWVCDLTPALAVAGRWWTRRDVTLVTGAAVHVPGGRGWPRSPGLPEDVVPAEWAEAVLWARGDLDPESISDPERLARAARAAGMRGAGLLRPVRLARPAEDDDGACAVVEEA